MRGVRQAILFLLIAAMLVPSAVAAAPPPGGRLPPPPTSQPELTDSNQSVIEFWEQQRSAFDIAERKGAALGPVYLTEASFSDMPASISPSAARIEMVLADPAYSALIPEAKKCAGRTMMLRRWYGAVFYLDECVTQVIEGLLWMGAGAATICSLLTAFFGQLPVSLICGMAAGLAGIGAGAIQAIDGAGANQGIIISAAWTGRILWIWHQ